MSVRQTIISIKYSILICARKQVVLAELAVHY